MTQRLRYATCAALVTSLASAQEALPVARATIYPGELISETAIDMRNYVLPPGAEEQYVHSRDALVGKVARRTLLPGKPILIGSFDNPRIVTVGAQIKLVYAEDGLQIVAFGIAQQAGGVGELIRVRNQQSGIFVTGRVQQDGSVRVGEG
jgi:flagella basal body P-ring formation protein FlgA